MTMYDDYYKYRGDGDLSHLIGDSLFFLALFGFSLLAIGYEIGSLIAFLN